MPLSSNPNATAPFWLPADENIPLAQRPVFRVRFMTEEAHQSHRELMQAATEAKDNAAAYAKVVEAIGLGVTGWERFADVEGKPIPWSADDLINTFARARLTERELWTVAWNYPSAVRLVESERPLSESPPSSAGDGSALNAEKQAAA